MKNINFKTTYDYKLSPYSGWKHEHWLEMFYQLMIPILEGASPGCARQIIPGQRSHHGRLADELEGFTRSMFMAGPWLSQSQDGCFFYDDCLYDVAQFYKQGILSGTDPKHPEYWGDIVDYAQHLVEMAALSWGLFLSKHLIWDKFSESEKSQVANYLYQCTQVKYHHNNWLLFNVITNSVLKKLGMPYSQQQIDENLLACDHMYIGEGWYRDGEINRIDYYNAWAFHFYYLLWAKIDGDSKPEIVQKHKQRIQDFYRDFRYFLGSDGAVPCFGRSMTYRFGYFSPIILAYEMGWLTDFAVGEIKTMLNLGVRFYADQEILTEKGHLSLGFLRPNSSLLEHYSCGGSPYWAVKTFSIFLISESDQFWQTVEEPLPIHQGNYCKTLQKAGLLLIGDKKDGHVQLVNHKSFHDKPDYNAKYTNTAYSSIFSFESRPVYDSFNCDTSFQFSHDNILFRQRWKMDHIICVDRFSGSSYPLYDVDDGGVGYSYTFVKQNSLINIHYVLPTKPLWYREGGYPIGFDSGSPRLTSRAGFEAIESNGKVSFIQNLFGYEDTQKAIAYAEDIQGTNVRYCFSGVPKLCSHLKPAKAQLFASQVYAGYAHFEKISQQIQKFAWDGDFVNIQFFDGETVFIKPGPVTKSNITVNGNSISGNIMMVYVDQNGQGLVAFEGGITQSL